MKVFSWNVKGIGNPSTRLVLSKFCIKHKPDLVFVSKPKIGLDNFPVNFLKRLNLRVFAINNRDTLTSNIWGICASNLNPSVLAASHQNISLSLVHNSQRVFISAIYASTSHIDRRSLWMELASLQQTNQGAWCCIGDFNAILGAHEKRGGRLPSIASCEEFKVWSGSCNLTYISTRGAAYTWS